VCKYYALTLYSLLFLGLPCISGCYVAGGVCGMTAPPRNIPCDNPCVITISIFVNPPEALGKHIERCKNVTLHIRNSLSDNFAAVPMVLESANFNAGELCWNATIEPIPCDSHIEYVEYYIDYTFGYNYSKYYRTNCYKVPVSKK
jgi:hypothetical protein